MDIQKLVQDTFHKHRKSVVLIVIRSAAGEALGHGTGFVIGKKGISCLVMTCCHVANNRDLPHGHILKVRLAGDPKEHRVTNKHDDEGVDLAIIQVYDVVEEVVPLQFRDVSDIAPETVVIKIGYINFPVSDFFNLDPSVTRGTVTTPLQQSGRRGREDVVYASSSKQGTSGSPLLVGDGVIGVHYANFQSPSDIMVARLSLTVNCWLKKWLRKSPHQTATTNELIEQMLRRI